jgi:hypothetical protein
MEKIPVFLEGESQLAGWFKIVIGKLTFLAFSWIKE